MYLYIKALHITFIVTWFAGLFYIVRLFIYTTEANEKGEPERSILQRQFGIMSRRLWFGITWPSAVLTAVFGPLLWSMLDALPGWLMVKIGFVLGLYGYHFSLHRIFREQAQGVFRYTSTQLRIWNEVATIFLIAIVMLATVKQGLSAVWGLLGLVGFVLILMSAIRIYKRVREKGKELNG
ncbi:MAG TPA: CopD family protein [Chitinophagaceae bacterium]|jgi:putative membrane protein|nr:CopD family protein [Chitinophagaceae bacterium]